MLRAREDLSRYPLVGGSTRRAGWLLVALQLGPACASSESTSGGVGSIRCSVETYVTVVVSHQASLLGPTWFETVNLKPLHTLRSCVVQCAHSFFAAVMERLLVSAELYNFWTSRRAAWKQGVGRDGKYVGDVVKEVVAPLIVLEVAYALLIACKVKTDDDAYARVDARLDREWRDSDRGEDVFPG